MLVSHPVHSEAGNLRWTYRQVTHLSSVHAMTDHALELLLRRKVADPAAHQIQDGRMLRYALPVQLRHLQGTLTLRLMAPPWP